MKLDKSYKARVTPEQSRQIQELAFKLGFEWYFSGKKILHTEISNLTLGINCMTLGCFESNEKFYVDTRFTEISATDLIALLTDLSKSAENPPQGMELPPEFEAVAHNVSEFKVGDPVYWGLKSRIFKIHRFLNTNVLEVELDGIIIAVHKDELCPATQENYGKLCSLFERIDFEQPRKELKGSDLARALIKKGWVGFNCLCGNSGDKNAITETIVTGVNNSGQFTAIDGKLFNNAIPVIGLRALEAREVGL